LYAVSSSARGSYLAVGEAGTTLRSTDGGREWNAAKDGAGKDWLSGVSAIDAKRAVAVGSHGQAWTTTDGGVTWSLPSLGPTTDVYSIARPSRGSIVLASGPRVYRSTDTGMHFSLGLLSPDAKAQVPIRSIHFADSLRGVAVGGNITIYRTTDGGVTWRRPASPRARSLFGRPSLKGVSYVDERRLVSIGWEWGAPLRRSDDGGMTWTDLRYPRRLLLSDVSLTANAIGLAVGPAGTVLRSTDAGAHFRFVSHGLSQAWLRGVTLIDSLAIIVGADGVILRSTDAGATWRRVANATTLALNAVSFADSVRGAVVGYDGLLLVSSDGGRSWLRIPTNTHLPLLSVLYVGDEVLVGGAGGLVLRITDGAAHD
jgi:photosystem II stability/assembly factor-like uncharacterized protein